MLRSRRWSVAAVKCTSFTPLDVFHKGNRKGCIPFERGCKGWGQSQLHSIWRREERFIVLEQQGEGWRWSQGCVCDAKKAEWPPTEWAISVCKACLTGDLYLNMLRSGHASYFTGSKTGKQECLWAENLAFEWANFILGPLGVGGGGDVRMKIAMTENSRHQTVQEVASSAHDQLEGAPSPPSLFSVLKPGCDVPVSPSLPLFLHPVSCWFQKMGGWNEINTCEGYLSQNDHFMLVGKSVLPGIIRGFNTCLGFLLTHYTRAHSSELMLT